MADGQKSDFERFKPVLDAEHAAIAARRGAPVNTVSEKPGIAESEVYDTTGLALSGGGIRSAAFCLGVLQALENHQLFKRVDYLSTVSGGGYIGASLTSALSANGGEFPFLRANGDYRDPKAIGHLRDHSNYLIPRGKRDLITDLAIIVRGLAANISFVLPLLLLLASLTIFLNPTREDLSRPAGLSWMFSGFFAWTSVAAMFLAALYLAWACYRSVCKFGVTEFEGLSLKVASAGLLTAAVIAFCELQPFLINWLFINSAVIGSQGPLPPNYGALALAIITYLAPAMAAISLFSKKISDVLELIEPGAGKAAQSKRIISKLAIWIAALALPVLIWLLYVLLVIWGTPESAVAAAPQWLKEIHRLFFPGSVEPHYGQLYFWLAAACIGIVWPLLTPNANSLHRLYRDRLQAAFLPGDAATGLAARDIRLSEFDTETGPYHLINAALNIHGSPQANQRGRNADFFVFSKHFCGSATSGYCDTRIFEKADTSFTLASAIATSGAAVSSNMGSASIAPLAPTLALLNLRLGYWLHNPQGKGGGPSLFFFAKEILSRLNPKDAWIYLTDGGHAENLGVYELLRRRCNFIIAADVEADPAMNFGSLVKLERYARIDLGVRINMYWDKIAAPGGPRKDAPHCAVGEILYSHGGAGVLLYIKASISGDENIYIRDYARRNPDFPHETTSDQFFSEEQFEVYRALGFHCLNGALKDEDADCVEAPKSELVRLRDKATDNKTVTAVRIALGLGDKATTALKRARSYSATAPASGSPARPEARRRRQSRK